MKKKKDLFIITLIYLLAFAVGFVTCYRIENVMLQLFVFDTVATVVTFIFSVILRNSSVYDAYWSLTPMVMSIWLFVTLKAFGVWQLLFLIVFNIWSIRLTLNWISVFTDFGYEDWRYRKFRDDSSNGFVWFVINFWGIHMMPTLVVFAGMLPLFEIARNPLGVMTIPGIFVILAGVCFEYFSDRAMHDFLAITTEKVSCRNGLWNYSRHPNYLGEICVWFGTFLVMIPYEQKHWYYVIGAVAVAILFNVVSIPLMEKRQLSRRDDYIEYRATTSRLLILPHKKK